MIEKQSVFVLRRRTVCWALLFKDYNKNESNSTHFISEQLQHFNISYLRVNSGSITERATMCFETKLWGKSKDTAITECRLGAEMSIFVSKWAKINFHEAWKANFYRRPSYKCKFVLTLLETTKYTRHRWLARPPKVGRLAESQYIFQPIIFASEKLYSRHRSPQFQTVRSLKSFCQTPSQLVFQYQRI